MPQKPDSVRTRVIEADGLVLRPPVEADAKRWFELARDPDEARWARPVFVDPIVSVEDVVPRILEAGTAIEDGQPATYVIADVERPDVFLGSIQWRIDTHPGKLIADIGYGVHPDARGRGVARRAIRGMARWLVGPEGPGMARVQLDHSVENIASCRAALAAGFEREGVRRSVLPLRDPVSAQVRRHDVCLHGFVPGE